MLRESLFEFRIYELESPLGIGTEGNTCTNLAEGMSRFIDLDVDMGVFEETNGKGQAAYASTDDSNAKGLWVRISAGGLVAHSSCCFVSMDRILIYVWRELRGF